MTGIAIRGVSSSLLRLQRMAAETAVWVLLGLPVAGAHAQTVMVQTVEAGSGQPVVGSIVRLVDSAGRVVVQALTDGSGRTVLRAPHRGSFTLRADRIGHLGTATNRFVVTDTLFLRLEMPIERVTLPELLVEGSTKCERRAEGVNAAALWNEIRGALLTGQIATASRSTELAVRRFHRFRTSSGALRSDSTEEEYRTWSAPFVSESPATLGREGYVRPGAGGGWRYSGPDAATLLFEEFLSSHCFDLTKRSKIDSGRVGLAFRPVDEGDKPDVRGSLWVDSLTLELRRVEFEYTGLPRELQVPGTGGRLEFERLPSGVWIINEWYIRTPDRVAMIGTGRFRRADRDTVVGLLTTEARLGR